MPLKFGRAGEIKFLPPLNLPRPDQYEKQGEDQKIVKEVEKMHYQNNQHEKQV
ncbi:unnamed protein product [Prunus armeniaca]|uniref:Uncharacterized protein n=1 Tax=Prunus armeniaca TaxID=36596 RepID=A0A6J5X6M0_PRUAR|nr:unnamed protein product [Prunus armeniaca]